MVGVTRFLRIELIGRFHTKQGFQTGDQGNGESCDPHTRIGNGCKVGEAELGKEPIHIFRYRYGDQVL